MRETPIVSFDSEEIPYSNILDVFNLQYKSAGYYWQIGDRPGNPCWVLNLSVTSSQVVALLRLIIPMLISDNVSFQVVRDKAMATFSLNGHLGIRYLAKMISIYPSNPAIAVDLAKKLIGATASFTGPAVRTDRHLGGIVYTCWPSHETVPFTSPPHIAWPFGEITNLYPAAKPKLLNFAYYPVRVIKADAKGDVIKALYFQKIWNIKPCIIKQARKHMLIDEKGRDIRDRLQWQFELYSTLSNIIPLPKIFDKFELEGDTYLAMQYINGKSFTTYLNDLHNDRPWNSLSKPVKIQIIDHFLTILDIIQKLHEAGYVHRDITPENFLLDKKNKIWLIDVELMWDSQTRLPSPPFSVGTPGFISPEQQQTNIPTVKEDIYAVGALMISFFTNLMPIKFQQSSCEFLERSILHFTNDKSMATVISSCFHAVPSDRPTLSTIRSAIILYRNKIPELKPFEPNLNDHVEEEILRKTIQLAINGLALSGILDPDGRWISKMPADSNVVGNEQLGMTVQEGWYRGVSGPLWLLGLSRQLHYDISSCATIYNQNWEYIQSKYSSKKRLSKTLYEGTPGIAIALTAGVDSGLLTYDSCGTYLEECFSKVITLPTLAEGIAGQGIALLSASHRLPPTMVEDFLSYYVNELIKSQKADGSWPTTILESRPGCNVYTLNHGISGTIWFLLAYLQKEHNPAAYAASIEALNYLVAKGKRKGKTYTWSNELWSTEKGDPGIALLFLKAYKVLKIEIYREIAESLIYAIPESPVIMNITLGSGLAGIGQLYLSAHSVLGHEIWRKRAAWIVQLLLHTLYLESENYISWLPNNQSDITADLFMGSSGIIHFLMRYHNPHITHPLDPIG